MTDNPTPMTDAEVGKVMHDYHLEVAGKHTQQMQVLTEGEAARNAALNAAEQRVGDTFRKFYVDNLSGDDANPGTLAEPFKTIGTAASRAVYGGRLCIYLMSDYHMDEAVRFRDGNIVIAGHNGRPKITFGPHSSNPSYLSGFSLSFSMGSFNFQELEFVFPKVDASLRGRYIISAHGLTVATIQNCDFTVEPDANVALFQFAHGIGLLIQNVTFPPEIGGRWVEGISAGTDPKTIGRIAYTNVDTL